MNAMTYSISALSAIRTIRNPVVMQQPFSDLILALQTTLDLNELLTTFDSHLKSAVAHDGFRYSNADGTLELSAGIQSPRTCRFDLHVENRMLGVFEISRVRSFTDSDEALFEAYACRLVYPLRNALVYREAINSAYLDPLTHTGNRNALFGSMQREWELANRHHQPLSLIMLDIDHFKTVNDTYGHTTGDAVLCGVANCINDTVRLSDIVFRYGGEEFLILLANTDESGATLLAERIRAALEQRLHLPGDGINLKVTASLGVASLRAGELQSQLIDRADKALYEAKGTGRNRVCVSATQPTVTKTLS